MELIIFFFHLLEEIRVLIVKWKIFFSSKRSILFIFSQILDQPECWFTRSGSREKFYFWFEHKISHTIIYVYSFSLPIAANDWNTLSSVKTHPRQYILLVVTNNDNQSGINTNVTRATTLTVEDPRCKIILLSVRKGSSIIPLINPTRARLVGESGHDSSSSRYDRITINLTQIWRIGEINQTRSNSEFGNGKIRKR